METEKVMSDKELRRSLETEMISVEFSVADLLLLRVASVFWDGRDRLTKIVRKRISPVAIKLLEERKELQ